jgi:hypothetical protein
MILLPSLRAPSSGPSGHLLPAGEKRERAVTAQHQVDLAICRTAAFTVWDAQRQRNLFSPAGRRWRVAPDEGAPQAKAHMSAPQANQTDRATSTAAFTNTTRGETT